jgi:hypothetical protein
VECCNELGQAFRWKRKDKFISYGKETKKQKKRKEERKLSEELPSTTQNPSLLTT